MLKKMSTILRAHVAVVSAAAHACARLVRNGLLWACPRAESAELPLGALCGIIRERDMKHVFQRRHHSGDGPFRVRHCFGFFSGSVDLLARRHVERALTMLPLRRLRGPATRSEGSLTSGRFLCAGAHKVEEGTLSQEAGDRVSWRAALGCIVWRLPQGDEKCEPLSLHLLRCARAAGSTSAKVAGRIRARGGGG